MGNEKTWTCGDCPWNGGFVIGTGVRRVDCEILEALDASELWGDDLGREVECSECQPRRAYRVLRDEVRNLRRECAATNNGYLETQTQQRNGEVR